MSSAMNSSEIDLSKITFSAPKTLDNGGKMLFLNYNGSMSPLYVTIPNSKLPFEPAYYADNDTSGKWGNCGTNCKNHSAGDAHLLYCYDQNCKPLSNENSIM